MNLKNILLTLGLTLPLALFIRLAKSNRLKLVCIVFIIVITLGERLYIFNKFNPFSPKEFFYPPTTLITWLKQNGGIDRFWGYGYGTISSNVASGVSLYDMQGYDPLYPKRYGEFVGLSKERTFPQTFTDTNRSNAELAPGFGEKDLMENTNRLRLLSLGGVKYILDRVENGSTENTFPASLFKNTASMNGWKIMESKHVTPRAFLTSEYKIIKTPKDYEIALMDKTFLPEKTVLLETAPDFANMPASSTGTVQIKTYQPNKIVMETNTTIPAMLVLTDTYYPGWTALVDNTPTPIFRADYTYRALKVPTGIHTVVLYFNPLSVRIGLILTISSILILLVFLIFYP